MSNYGESKISGLKHGPYQHDLKELLINNFGTYLFVGCFYCIKCKKLFKKSLTELK